MTTEQRHETAQLTPGTILKTAREQRGMSQQDVAHRLNLRISLIRDIEEDRFDQKTASTFTRGYLKTYARFVGTDEQAVLAAYDRLGLNVQQYSAMYSFSGRTQREASEHRVRFISWVLFIGLAGLGGTWWWLQPAEEPVP
ncbi:MAG: helix-turn-helix domain-containing protein, partial [Tolumonas sp.]|nr:helix-turn-helix domain-containing protein [Tolumonas sp.]